MHLLSLDQFNVSLQMGSPIDFFQNKKSLIFLMVVYLSSLFLHNMKVDTLYYLAPK